LKIVASDLGSGIEKKLKKTKDIDILFAPAGSENIAFLNTDLPIIHLGDATFKMINDYYPYFSNLPNFNIKDADEIEYLALTKAAHVILSSDWAKGSAVNDYGIPEEKISVLEFGANLEVPSDLKRPEKGKDLKLLFIGKEWSRKGGDIAVQTTKRLLSKYKIPALLHIVGCRPEIALDSSIEVIGYLNKNNPDDYKKICNLFLESDLFFLPTKAECSAVVFSEASGFGLPILTYDTGGSSNYVLEGINGYRFPLSASAEDFADLIARLHTKNSLPQLSVSARKVYEDKLNWVVWGKKFKDIVSATLNHC
jgi:glycosyltransferase involved in cell wall biosynthesis